MGGVLAAGLVGVVGLGADHVKNDNRALRSAGDAVDNIFNTGQEADGKEPAQESAAPGAAATPNEPDIPSASPETDAAALPDLSCMPIDMRLGQLLIVGVKNEDLAQQGTIDLFSSRFIGGAILMTAPPKPAEGVPQDILAFKASVETRTSIPILTSTDEEGGARDAGGVQRFRDYGELPLAEEAAASMTPEQLTAAVQAHGTILKEMGIDMVYGPVVDVNPLEGEGPLPGRIVSNDPQVVAEYAGAAVAGWQASGIRSFIKHFPGLGSGTENTDEAPSETPPLDGLREHDLIPYEELKDSGAGVMLGNQIVPGLTDGHNDDPSDDEPTSMSRPAVDLLRNELGYADALVVTDSLNAAAIPDTAVAVEQAIEAGVDMAMIVGARDGETIEAVVDEAIAGLKSKIENEDITENEINDSVIRVLQAKGIDTEKICAPA
jgi:beta-N-acetylhexosaminidase